MIARRDGFIVLHTSSEGNGRRIGSKRPAEEQEVLGVVSHGK